MKRNIYRFTAICLLALPAAGVGAQNLDENVTVEGRYRPEYIPAERLPSLPATVTLAPPESRLDFDRRGIAADFAPDGLNMPPTGWRAQKRYDSSRGYLDASLGSWLNASLSAGYEAVRSDETNLRVWLQHCSTSLWQAWKNLCGAGDADLRKRYDETIGADLRHKFGTYGTLEADLRYHLGYFNYYSAFGTGEENAPTQTLNDISAALKWSAPLSEAFNWNAYADIRHFAYREGERETTLRAGGEASRQLSRKSRIGATLDYSGVFNSIGNNVGRLRLQPGYDLTDRNMNLHAGVEIALVDAAKTHFRIAPDLRFGYREGIVALSTGIGGGTQLRTLAWQHEMDYYANPYYGCTEATYSPIDANIGIRLNPGGEWTAGVDWRWRTTIDEAIGGWFMIPLIGIYDDARALISPRLHGFSLAVNAGYEPSRYLALSVSGTWQPQHGNTGYLNGLDRAQLTLEASATSHPTDALELRLGYVLRAKRYLLPEKNFSRLDFRGSYRISDRTAVYAELHNILNRRQYLLPGVPLEGITAMAGFQISF